ncbi:ankyrin repeat domain-containing protein, partial [Klebsiella pneumoniae]|nr:ankyrin repeat domain-containing protein [Klebsiella pneumoniae]
MLGTNNSIGVFQNGTSALHAAVLSGNVRTVALLLEAGADPCLRNKVRPGTLSRAWSRWGVLS